MNYIYILLSCLFYSINSFTFNKCNIINKYNLYLSNRKLILYSKNNLINYNTTESAKYIKKEIDIPLTLIEKEKEEDKVTWDDGEVYWNIDIILRSLS